MANGYIGKISALVTASTADLSRKLQGSTRDVDRFARSIQSQIAGASRSAQASLGGIFTPLQRIQRALDISGRSGLNLLKPGQLQEIQRAVSVAEGINKPLAAATRQFQGLSSEVQAQFLPALDLAQRRVAGLNDLLARSGNVSERAFAKTAERVERTSQAIQRLTQAQRAASAGFTGNELEFTNPRALEAINAAAAASQRAASLPASQRQDPAIAGRVRQLSQFRNLVAQGVAELERLELSPDVDEAAFNAAKRRLDNLIETARRAQQEFGQIAAAGSLNILSDADLQSEAASRIRRREQEEAASRQRREEELRAARGRRTELPAGFSEGVGRDRVRGRTGSLNLDSTPPPAGGFSEQATRDIDALATRVGAVRQQLETLPNSIRTRFIPELQRAQAQLVKLQNSPAATVQAIENATQRVQRLEAAARRASEAFNFRQSFGGAGLRGIEEGLNQQALRGYAAQLQLLQQTLAGTSQAARGPAVVAFNNLRNAIADAMARGTLETQQTRRVIQQLTQDAVRATAAAANIGEGGLTRRLQRVGDIGRGSFGNLGLGIQQAIFAFDDFFSVTGDLDQRIRAAGNNISQLGFVVGGTAGLVAGVLVAAFAQGAVALVNWYNEGIKASDSTKVLNDALARQKSLVEELAEAFRSLGDDLARRAFSGPAQEAREFTKQIDSIIKKQRELRESRVADLDPGVQRERGRQESLSRRLEGESDPGRRVDIQRRLEESRRVEEEARRRAVDTRATGQDVIDLIARQTRRFVQRPLGSGAASETFFEARARNNRLVSSIDTRDSLDGLRSQRSAIDQEIARLRRELTLGAGGDPNASTSIAELQQLRNSLEIPLQKAIDELAVSVVRASQSAAVSIESAQEDVAEAIRRGVRGAGAFQAELDSVARQLTEANAAIEAAAEIENPEQREAAVRRAQDRVREVAGRQEAINESARAVRLGRGFGGVRTESALSALNGNERFVNEQARLTARVAAAVDGELQARRNLDAAIASGDEAARERAAKELEAAQAIGDLAAAAAENALSLEQAFGRIRKTADNFLSASEGLADDAQRRLDESATPGAARDRLTLERDEAERQLIEDRRRASELQARLDRERSEAGRDDPRIQDINQRLTELRSEREDAAARARLGGIQEREQPADAQARANEEARLLARRAEIVRQSTAGTQRLIDEENRLVAARRAAAERAQKQREFEVDLERRRNPGQGAFGNADAARGLGLVDTPAKRAAGELRQNLADIDRAVQAAGDAAIVAVRAAPNEDFRRRAREELRELQGQANAARKRIADEAFRANAPAIFALADQVANAVVQGPSRAALQATDVSTLEGSRELNRLLRGDDSARDQNLVELQKQSQSLDELVRIAREGGAQIAN
jgi:hypothetical protein